MDAVLQITNMFKKNSFVTPNKDLILVKKKIYQQLLRDKVIKRLNTKLINFRHL